MSKWLSMFLKVLRYLELKLKRRLPRGGGGTAHMYYTCFSPSSPAGLDSWRSLAFFS